MNPNELEAAQAVGIRLDDLTQEHPELMEEVELRVAEAVEAARLEWQKAENERLARMKAEAEKEASMTAEEKAIRAELEKEDDLARREKELARRELRLSAMEKLAQRRLPMALLDSLCYDDSEKCEASIDKVENAFRAAVQQGVNGRLQGKAPEIGGDQPDLSVMSDEDYYKMTYPQGKKE